MKSRIGRPLLLGFLLLVAAGFGCLLLLPKLSVDQPVRQGKADYATQAGKVVALSGDWELYYNRLETRIGEDAEEQKIDACIPGVWNGLLYQGKPLDGFGFGTYRVRIEGLTPGTQYGLYIPLLSVSYQVFIDGKAVAQNGVVSSTQEGFVPSFLPQTAIFTASGSEAELCVQTSNYIYARNGMWHSIYLGTTDQIVAMNRTVLYKDVFFLGAFLTLAIYYASTYALRREKQSLLFVLLCVGAAMRILVNGDRVIVRLVPAFPLEWIVRCDYWAILLFYPIMLYLMTRRFPNECSKPFAFGVFGLGLAGSILVLFLPVSVFTKYVVAAEALLFLNILSTLGMLARAVLRGRKSAAAMFTSVLLLLVLTLHDTLYQMGRIDSAQGEIAAYGFFIFLLLESFAISRDYAESFRSVKELSTQLLESEALKDRIRKTEMAFLQSQIKPHFLYNTLSVIDEYCLVDPPKASRLINTLAQYLRRSFVFDNLEDGIPIEKELAHVRSYVEIEQARFSDLAVEYELDYANSFLLPPLTIQPLVENAIRHGVRKKAGAGKVCVRIRQTEDGIEIAVSDNGAGIPPDKLETLFTEPTASVGLINIHNRLLHQYGRGLTIASVEGEGTTVGFQIPKQGRG